MKLKYRIIYIQISLVLLLIFFIIFFKNPLFIIEKEFNISKIFKLANNKYENSVSSEKILKGAKLEIDNKTKYKSVYYEGGYPPDDEGVCTDVIWRALKHAGYDLKLMMDIDILNNTDSYKRINTSDPNIDFRRVKNQYVFLKKYTHSLTTEVIINDKLNLSLWKAGDIVVLKNPDHIAVISDKRNQNGVPLVIHNGSTIPKEEDLLMYWNDKNRIIGHFRF